MNAKEAKLQLKKWEACPEGLARIRGTRTIAEMISKASISDLEWAILMSGLQAKYEKVCNPAYIEYDKVRALAYAEYHKVCDLAYAEYSKVRDQAYTEYSKVRDQASAEYEKVRADTAWKMLMEKYK